MGKKDKSGGRLDLSRRDFLKVAGAGAGAAVVGTGAEWAFYPGLAAGAYPANAVRRHTTCPYCSAQCGQTVVMDASGTVLDIHGMVESPINQGGLCAKGAGGFQLATNERRLGVPAHTADVDGFDFTGRAWKRQGDEAWVEGDADAYMAEAAAMMVTARNTDTTNFNPATGGNSDGVMFFGSSHANNEVNYLYRKLIANFGTSNTEHQARI